MGSHAQAPQSTQTRFLNSQNPALAKRNVLASFTDVLLLPVTIVPRAVGAGVGAIGTNVGSGLGAMGSGVVQGISMLNPQRWMGTGETATRSFSINETTQAGYENVLDEGTLFEVGEDEGEESVSSEGHRGTKRIEVGEKAPEGSDENMGDEAGWGEVVNQRLSTITILATNDALPPSSHSALAKPPATTTPPVLSKAASGTAPSSLIERFNNTQTFSALDLLLSLDVSLKLIHATRDALKRLETFGTYPRPMGTRVRETLEEVFCEMLSVLGTRHIGRGFGM